MPATPGHVNLPIAPRATRPRPSRRGRWRTLVLTSVYVFFIGHYIHWLVAERTLTPLEPSESMYTLEQGLLNAGFVVFTLGILSTLLLGRWFCGWGCHIIALQDLCTWLLKRMRFRPKPLRSRVLIFVPLLAALYMFVWPTARRIWRDQPAPEIVYHFFTYDYWATFPGLWISLLTFAVCGFLIVVLLGNKGYCTYACPYGGFFALADRVSPGRIRVTDACSQCGHCTAACTSNVRVHEEVHQYGMVVSPGCMKCTDCVSVCPNDALYFGFGPPAVMKGSLRTPARLRPSDYTWWEELLLAACFGFALYAWRGLYDAIPFLLALGLSAICAYLLVQVLRVAYVSSLTLHRVQLRLKGRVTRAGWIGAAGAAALVILLAHAAVVQFHRHRATHLLATARALQRTAANDAEVRLVSRAAQHHLLTARQWGWFTSAPLEAQLGALALYLDETDAARQHLQAALARAPHFGEARYHWAQLVAREQGIAAGLPELERAVRDNPALADARRDLIAASRRLGRLPETLPVLDHVVTRRPHDPLARVERAVVLADAGQLEAALESSATAVQRWPLRPDVLRLWAELLVATGRLSAEIARRDSNASDSPENAYALSFLHAAAGDASAASAALKRARHRHPDLESP